MNWIKLDKNILVLSFSVLLWYSASAFANTSSRKLLTTVCSSALLLTFTQFLTTSILLSLFQGNHKEISTVDIFKSYVLDTKGSEVQKLLFKLSVVYCIGFIFVNGGYVYVNVSLAETLRAGEPLVSIFLVKYFLPSERTSALMVVSMCFIFVGGLLSSLSDTSFSLLGLLFVTISNLSFSTRSLLTKQIKELTELDSFALFLIISKVGTLFLGAILILTNLIGYTIEIANFDFIYILVVNNVSYFLYNQMSFFVLSKVSMVSHAVTNALRRVVTIMFSVWYFQNEITVINAIGIFLAIFGLLLYSYAKSSMKALEQVSKEEEISV